MQRIIFFLIVFFCISGLFLSCTKEDYCAHDVTAFLKIGFYTREEGELVQKSMQSFTAKGFPSDSILYNNKSNLKTIELPLSNLSDTARFAFIYKFSVTIIDTTWLISDSLSLFDTLYSPDTTLIPTVHDINDTVITKYQYDTLEIIYSRRMYLVSPLCGFGYDYEILEANFTYHYMDSAYIDDRFVIIVDEENEDNLKILY